MANCFYRENEQEIELRKQLHLLFGDKNDQFNTPQNDNEQYENEQYKNDQYENEKIEHNDKKEYQNIQK